MSQDQAGEDYWRENYTNAQRRGLQGWGNSIIDHQVERYAVRWSRARILEIGASSCEHLEFVRPHPSWSLYIPLDLRPGVTDPEGFRAFTKLPNIAPVTADAQFLPFPDKCFDLATSTCVLAHVRNPEATFVELRRVTKSGGVVVVGMPTDPGMANRAVKQLVTYRSMRKSGIQNPRLMYAREHINPVGNLIELARSVFRADKIRFHYYPLRIPSWNLNLVVTMQVVIS